MLKKKFLGINNCLLKINSEGHLYWFKDTTFKLPNNTQERGKCQLSSGIYTCNISTIILDYEPTSRWLTLGYPCGEQKNLSGFQYQYQIKALNTTQCELMDIPQNIQASYFQCNRFYDYISFPNVFGHRSQGDTIAMLHLFQNIVGNMDYSCHKHLDYALCQAFFQRCPDETNEDNKIVSHLDVMCEQMCLDVLDACNTSLQPFTNFIDCSYYRMASNISCTYKSVLCNSPPSIQNGHITTDDHNKTVGSTVKYSCDNDYNLTETT